jgi:LysR family transcriptional regulator, chromosome initiation inhibitor
MSQHLDPKQLDALLAVAEHASFSKAAVALRLTLAAVSLRVSALEESLGQRLLVRGKRVSVTPSGSKLLAHVRHVRLMEADLLSVLLGHGDASAGRPMQIFSDLVFERCVANTQAPSLVVRHHD